MKPSIIFYFLVCYVTLTEGRRQDGNGSVSPDPNPETSTEPYVSTSTTTTTDIYPYSTYIAAPRVYYDELKDSEELEFSTENIKVENDFPPLDLPYPKSSRISKNEDIDPIKIERKWRFEGDDQTEKYDKNDYEQLRNANDRDWNDEFDVNRDRHRLFKDSFNDPRSEEDSNPDGGDNTHKPHLGASRRRPSSSRDQGSREVAEKLGELKRLNRLIRMWLKKNHHKSTKRPIQQSTEAFVDRKYDPVVPRPLSESKWDPKRQFFTLPDYVDSNEKEG